MSITFWFSFFFAGHSPAHTACTTQGVPLIEIRDRSEIDRPTTTTKIFESGAWTTETQGNLERGCFDRKELRSIRQSVASAPWKVTSSPIACFAYDPNFTEYVVHGKLRFTDRMCSGKQADSETRNTIELIKQELADEHPAPPPVATCNANGTPLFEIRKRSEADGPTSTARIYANGAWTFQPQKGALMTGCFDKSTTASLKHVVNDSPWDASLLQMTCRAYSPNYTEYYVHGELEYTARMCGAQRLDDKSLGAIKIVETELAKVAG
jgi:hypothetical protein